jgi:hypothetical protein
MRIDSLPCLFGDLKLHRHPCLALTNRRSLQRVAMRCDIRYSQPNEGAAPKLAIDREIKHRQIFGSPRYLRSSSYRPDMLRTYWWPRTTEFSLVPRYRTGVVHLLDGWFMDRVRAQTGELDKANAVAYRNALMLTILVQRGPRRRALAGMRLGQHLVKVGNMFHLVFGPQDTKTGKALETLLPDLRLIDDELWDAVKARQKEATHTISRDDAGIALNRVHRRQFLPSGLLTCGICGGGYTTVGKDRYGCATRRIKGTCNNERTIKRQEIEARVFDGLKQPLVTPDLVETFVSAFHEEIN